MKKITIKKDELIEVLETEIKNAEGFPWTGWHIPIYTDEDGKVSAGGWLSNNSYQPNAIMLVGIDPWHVEDVDDCIGQDGWTKEDAIDDHISLVAIDYYIEKIERIFNDESVDEYGKPYYELEIVD